MVSGSGAEGAPIWFKSSYSGANETECVEAAFVPDGVAVRDSKNISGPRLSFGADAWSDFIAFAGA